MEFGRQLCFLVLLFCLYVTFAADPICPSGIPAVPDLPKVYSVTYEFSQLGAVTGLIHEEHDIPNLEIAVTEIINNEKRIIYERPGGLTRQIFELNSGNCKELSEAALVNSSLFANIRKSVKFLKDKNIYLGLLLNVLRNGSEKHIERAFQKDLSKCTDVWEYNVGDVQVKAHWTVRGDTTQAADPYPIKLAINYINGSLAGMQENIFVFQYSPDVDAAKLNLPDNVYCEGLLRTRLFKKDDFIGNNMYFSSEIIDSVKKTAFATEHYYELDRKLVVYTSRQKVVKNKIVPARLTTIFDYNMGYYFVTDDLANGCKMYNINDYVGNIYDIFERQKMLADITKFFGEDTNYTFIKKAWRKNLMTELYQGFKTHYPDGPNPKNSIVNWYLAKNIEGKYAPESIDIYIKSKSGKEDNKITFDFFNWKKLQPKDVLYNIDQFLYKAKWCTKTYHTDSYNFDFTISDHSGYLDSRMMQSAMQVKIARTIECSELRLTTRLEKTLPKSGTFGLYISDKFDTKISLNSNTLVANLKKAIDNGKISITMKSRKNEDVTITAIKDSLILHK